MRLKPYHPLSQGMILAYMLNENGGNIVYDATGKVNTGTVVGAEWVPDGMDFIAANTDYVDVLDSVAGGHDFTGLSDNITVVAGINPDIVTGTDTYWRPSNCIIELRTQQTTGAHVPFSFGIDDSKLLLGVTDNYITTDERKVGSATLGIDTDYTIGFTIEGDDWNLYLNGISDNNGAFSQATGDRSVGSTICNMQIGVRSTDVGAKSSSQFDGTIKYIYIYDRTLSADEMMWLDHNPYGMFEADFIPSKYSVEEIIKSTKWYFDMLKRRNS